MNTDFVPLDLLAEDHDAFAAWDAEHPDKTRNTPGSAFPLWQTGALNAYISQMHKELEGLLGREDDEAGRRALDLVTAMLDPQRELAIRGEMGAFARLQQLDQAQVMLRETLDARLTPAPSGLGSLVPPAPKQAPPEFDRAWSGPPSSWKREPKHAWQLGSSVAGALKNSKKLGA